MDPRERLPPLLLLLRPPIDPFWIGFLSPPGRLAGVRIVVESQRGVCHGRGVHRSHGRVVRACGFLLSEVATADRVGLAWSKGVEQ